MLLKIKWKREYSDENKNYPFVLLVISKTKVPIAYYTKSSFKYDDGKEYWNISFLDKNSKWPRSEIIAFSEEEAQNIIKEKLDIE